MQRVERTRPSTSRASPHHSLPRLADAERQAQAGVNGPAATSRPAATASVFDGGSSPAASHPGALLGARLSATW
jgi:hypothetical protein